MVISQSDFDTWKAEPTTRAFYHALADQIGRVKEFLADSAGLDPNEDNFRRGYIRALQDALLFSVEEANDD